MREDKWTWAQLFKQEKRYRNFYLKNNFLSTDHRMYIVSRQTEQTVTLQKRETKKLVNMFKVREEKN